MTYRPRVVDTELRERLAASGAVLIEGPRASGKTETARQVAASEVLLDTDVQARLAISIDPSLVLAGATPRLLDEWQVEPTIWNHVRRAVDERREVGQFILTGSAVPTDDATRHPGAGRFSRLRMRTMSLYETGHSNGQISLRGLLAGDPARAADPGTTLDGIVERIAVGGWPGVIGLPVPAALRRVSDYLDEVRRVDLRRLDGPNHDPARVGRVLRAIARGVASPVAATTIAADAGGAEGPLDADTVRAYLEALERVMVTEDQPAWAPHLRSRSILRSSPKRHLADPSLAVAALQAGPDRLVTDLSLLGHLFESLVVHDLRVHAQALDAQVLHYRDNTGSEVDAIVELRDGSWAAFEIKLGSGGIDQGAASLHRFVERVDQARVGAPRVLGVITAFGYGYVRPDGVAVIPIGTLGP
ncbi:MAG: DUF4143 domain-containing protein [Chloroflexota bacterium]